MKPGWVPSWCELVSFHPRKAKLRGFGSPVETVLPGTAGPSRLQFGTEQASQQDCVRRLCRNLPPGPVQAAELLPGCRRYTRFCDAISDRISDEELALGHPQTASVAQCHGPSHSKHWKEHICPLSTIKRWQRKI